MKFTVDTGKCIGAGQCALVAPEVFDQDDDGTVVVLRADPPAEADGAVEQAAALCPAAAITLAGS